MSTNAEAVAVTETRLIHAFHRRATTLLSEAALRPSVPLAALAELREFLVQNLRHHHATEDHQLWPMIAAVAPEAAAQLAALSEEHDALDAALDALEAAPSREDGDRPGLQRAAEAVRALVHRHLEHEEPILFPALREHISPDEWTAFSREVVATSPSAAAHLIVGFLDQVGTPEEVALVLSGLPEPAQRFVPVMRDQAHAALAVLSGATEG
ncbi:hemerythrin-like domain-containing protein [Nonomuraea polychroma]|uniref:Hemerythrin-like domain-containing protein n=1 Tax=Nonomuraea polychroma TaxID=46176 RepID=A0A438MJ06_9ACTN|nr:hemerythrin domain-containing protein [Nonomuraea polychroma]RVX45817.1 hemerythrin-like domain-containing protein [Nonomuraea polychroma]